MKIILVDNFARDYYPDELIVTGVSRDAGQLQVDLLNHRFSGPESPDYYRLVDDDYELYTEKFVP